MQMTFIRYYIIIIIVLLNTNALSQSIPSGAIGVWHLDEGNGTNTADASGNNNNGTLIGGASWTTGISGTAVNFNSGFGGSESIQIADNPTLRPGNISLSCWVRTQGPISGYRQTIIGKSEFSNANNEQYNLQIDFDGKPQFLVKRNSSCLPAAGWNNLRATVRVDDSQWHHIVGTYDGSLLRIYVDGVLSGSISVASPGNIDNCVGGTLRFARWWATDPGNFRGDLDEVIIYGRALTQQEVNMLFSAPFATSVPTLSTWGLIILALLILNIGGVLLYRRATLNTLSN